MNSWESLVCRGLNALPQLKLHNASEAITEFDQAGKSEAVTMDSVKASLAEAETGAAEQKQIIPGKTRIGQTSVL